MTKKCPNCNYSIKEADKVKFVQGNIIQCPCCGVNLEVNRDLELEPVNLESVF
jgi:hypothetical protein